MNIISVFISKNLEDYPSFNINLLFFCNFQLFYFRDNGDLCDYPYRSHGQIKTGNVIYTKINR